MTAYSQDDSLVILRDWESGVQNPKYKRMLQRREKILKNLPAYRRQLRVLEKLMAGTEDDGLVLEVACGMGFHLLELSARGWHIVGAEIDPNLSQLSYDVSARFQLPLITLTGDACAIPVADNSCAVVLSHSFFEHVYDVDLALREQIRVLKPSGRLLILDGNLLNPKTLFDLLILYPLRTRGQHGGLKWWLTKGQVHNNLYGYLPLGRDEDCKTPGWWKRRVQSEPCLKLLQATTGGHFTHSSLPSWLQMLIGSCVVVAEKR